MSRKKIKKSRQFLKLVSHLQKMGLTEEQAVQLARQGFRASNDIAIRTHSHATK